MKYNPSEVPANINDLPNFLHRELEAISDATGETPVLHLQVSHRPPEKLRNGMIVLADGTDWNPGSGAGFYGYNDGAWHFLG